MPHRDVPGRDGGDLVGKLPELPRRHVHGVDGRERVRELPRGELPGHHGLNRLRRVRDGRLRFARGQRVLELCGGDLPIKYRGVKLSELPHRSVRADHGLVLLFRMPERLFHRQHRRVELHKLRGRNLPHDDRGFGFIVLHQL